MAESRDERIRRRAYEIWEREGTGHGRHEEHWHRAAAEIDAEEDRAGGSAAGTAAAPEDENRPRDTAAEHAPGERTVSASGRSAGEATRQNGPGNEPARLDEAARAAAGETGGSPARRRKSRTRD